MMTKNILPRIASVKAFEPSMLHVTWRDKQADTVDLVGWIATGGVTLAALKDWAKFRLAKVADYGAAVSWDDDDDLAIDGHHLKMLADEQKPFTAQLLKEWQTAVALSNNEAADLLNVNLSTFNAWKAGANIPTPVAIACRAAQRDPILMQAHYRPRRTGRPKTRAAAKA